MKKFLSIALVIALVLSLCVMFGCEKEEPSDTTPEDTTPAETTPAETDTPSPEPREAAMTIEELEATKPNEYIQEKLDAGLQPLIVFVTPILADAFIAAINEGFKNDFEALGFSYTVQDAEGDMSRMLTLFENAMTMNASTIIVLAYVEGLGDVCAQVEAAGTNVVVFGAKPSFPVAGLVSLDQYEQGKQGALMASAWMDQVYPDAADGSVSAMLTINVGQEDNILRSNAYEEWLAADPRITISYIGTHSENSIDEGFTFAEEAFTVDPNVRVALGFTPSALYGINNYILAHFTADQYPEFGLFCNSQEETLFQLIEAGATNDGSVIRGTIAQGGESAHMGPLNCVKALLLEGAPYGYIEYDRIYAVDNFGYTFDSAPQ